MLRRRLISAWVGSAVGISLLVPAQLAVAAAGTFLGPGEAYDVGFRAESVVIGDFTGDDRNDVVLSTSWDYEEGEGKIFFFVQQADGTLAAPVPMGTDIAYADHAGMDAGDLNADGKTDLALATSAGVDIYHQAAGGLQPRTLIPTSEIAREVIIADAEEDGDEDIFVCARDRILLLQRNAGGFTEKLVTTHGQTEMELGDVTGDGRLDVVGFTDRHVNVFPQQADGSFAVGPSYEGVVDFWPSADGLEVADVTGDGKADAMLTIGGHGTAGLLNVFRQTSGAFSAPVVYEAPDGPKAVEASDMNADGRLDVVIAHPGRVGILDQAADGALEAERRFQFFPSGGAHFNAQGIDLGDITGDGRPDVVLADYERGLVVFEQTDAPPEPSPLPPPPDVDLGEIEVMPTSTRGRLMKPDERRGRHHLYEKPRRISYRVSTVPIPHGAEANIVLHVRYRSSWWEAESAMFPYNSNGRISVVIRRLAVNARFRIGAVFDGDGAYAPSFSGWSFFRTVGESRHPGPSARSAPGAFGASIPVSIRLHGN